MSEAQYQTILSVVHDVYLGYSTGDRPKRMEIQQVIWLRFYNHRDIKPEDTECTKGTRMQECLSKSQRGATSPEQNSWQKLESLNGNFQWKKTSSQAHCGWLQSPNCCFCKNGKSLA
jgi:hypothetical protein